MMLEIIFGIGIIFIAYVAISQTIKFKKKKENKVFDSKLSTYTKGTLEHSILYLINSYRNEKGLSILTADEIITKKAHERCLEMVAQRKLSHEGYKDVFHNLVLLGADSVGEIIAYGFSTAQAVLNGWLNSEKHKNIIENAKYEYVGVYAHADDFKRIWYCVIFVNDETKK